MRLWSLHPRYLDRQGLTAVWREGLLAQAVLRGNTKGYKAHPQLERFRASGRPLGMIAAYLHAVKQEATTRGYHFDGARIIGRATKGHVTVTRGQVQWEWRHLMQKLRVRSPDKYERWREVNRPKLHPLFRPVAGGIAAWERPSTQVAELASAHGPARRSNPVLVSAVRRVSRAAAIDGIGSSV